MPTILRIDSTKPIPAGTFPRKIGGACTSPPYWGQRAYGEDEAELGASGQSRKEYLGNLVIGFRHLREHMDPRALLWVNIADTASKSGGAGGDYNAGGEKEGKPRWKQGDSDLPAMTWCNIPGTFADLMIIDGWLLRSEIVWDKGQERREALPHVRRVRPAHEKIFCFAQQRKYRWDHTGLEETGSVWHFADSAEDEALLDQQAVWSFPPGGEGPKHLAPFPSELPRRCIRASGSVDLETGEPVPMDDGLPALWVDPYAGSGTTLRVAEEMGLDAIGLDLYAA